MSFFRPRMITLAAMLSIGLITASGVPAHAASAPVIQRLEQLARDAHSARNTASAEGAESEAGLGAAARQSASLDELNRLMATVDTPDQAKRTIDQMREFGYRATTAAELDAYRQGLQLLSGRLDFLARSESPAYRPCLDEVMGLVADAGQRTPTAAEPLVERARRAARPTASRTASRGAPGMLGCEVVNGKTSFEVYSPAATAVNVVLFKKPGDTTGTAFPMKKDPNGIWKYTIDKDVSGSWYSYAADGPSTDGHLFDPKRLLSDPYALVNHNHDGKSLVPAPDLFTFKWTDDGFKTPQAKDLVIYEMHVKDLTAHPSSGVTAAKRGTYLGLLEGRGTDKVLGHLEDLGVNAVELLPCQEFDNNFASHPNHWGYMTSHFFAPETSYATGKNGEAIREFKQMVNGLHRAGIAVIMDVVYNHTAEGDERGLPINFKGLDNPGYYRLTDNPKYYWNGTGCGNEFRSDNPMTRKLILDSLKYWMREYHVDGFRFDLGTILDKDTMSAIMNELPASAIVVAEPWAADWKRNQWGKSDFRNTKLGKWNDDFREKIRGFINGNGDRNAVMTVLAGSCFWWSAKPSESVNYIECHDGATLSDLLRGNKDRFRLGAVALLTSQGITMIHEGQEFMRSKKGNDNSYDQDNAINWLDWNEKKANQDVYEFYKGLIGLRMKYENFRHATALNGQHIDWLQPANHRGLGYLLKGKTDLLVLMNSDSNDWITFNLPDGNDWIVVCNGEKVDDKGITTARGTYNVPPLRGIILKNKN